MQIQIHLHKLFKQTFKADSKLQSNNLQICRYWNYMNAQRCVMSNWSEQLVVEFKVYTTDSYTFHINSDDNEKKSKLQRCRHAYKRESKSTQKVTTREIDVTQFLFIQTMLVFLSLLKRKGTRNDAAGAFVRGKRMRNIHEAKTKREIDWMSLSIRIWITSKWIFHKYF